MPLRLVLMTTICLVLASCSNRNPLEVTISRCPAIAVLGDVGTLVKFNGDGRLNDDVAFVSTISDLKIECNTGKSIDSTVSLRIKARMGDAMVGSSANIQYFVVVMKDNHQIVTKRVFDTTLHFDSANGFAEVEEVISQHMPSVDRARHYNYELLVGFQMTDEEVAYNLSR